MCESSKMSGTYSKGKDNKGVRKFYHIKEGFCLQDFDGENLVIPVEKDTINENQIATLSSSGMFLWNELQEEQTFEDLVESLLEEYDVSRQTAENDIQEFFLELNKHKYLIVKEEKS